MLAWVVKIGSFCVSSHYSFVTFKCAGREGTYPVLSQVVANPQFFYLRRGTGGLYHCNEGQSVGPTSFTSTMSLDC